jgi:hypothetical protein
MMLATALLVPLSRLSRRPEPPENSSREAPADVTMREVWMEYRFSHPPRGTKLWQEGRILWEGGQEMEGDEDLQIGITRNESALRLEVEWDGHVEQAYAEIRLEPVDLEPQTFGAWGRNGRLDRSWRIAWEELP